LPKKIWKQNWGVDCAATGSGENALAYLARYVFKTATGNRPLQLLPSGEVIWPYRDSNTGQHKSIPLQPTELVRRFLQHVLPKGFCRVRLFGWFHPAGKIRGNRVRALLEQTPILTPQERQAWQQLEDSPVDFEAGKHSSEVALNSQPVCRCCGRPMLRIGSLPRLPVFSRPTRPRAP